MTTRRSQDLKGLDACMESDAMINCNSARARFAADTVFRVLFSVVFFAAGLKHLVDGPSVAQRLEAAPLAFLATALAPAPLLVLLVGVALLAGGAALAVGYQTRFAAILLIVVLIPITLTVQVGNGDLGPLMKNIALLGGLIHFAAHGAAGAGASIDCALSRRTR